MKILVTGTRGIPNILGGVETHCEALYPRLVEKGVDVTLARRSDYVAQDNKLSEYKGVKLVDIHSPQRKSFEAIVHTFLTILHAKRNNFKLIHIHAIGPSIMIPFARLMGIKVIMTHHGPDYDRQKWGRLAKTFLKLGEWCAARFANEIIVISETIKGLLKQKYNRTDTHLIYNGVDIPEPAKNTDYITSLGIEKHKYIIAVGRFVPEKGLHDLLDAYKNLQTDSKLVLVGDADHESEYSINIKERAKEEGVILTGFIKGEELHQIFSYAGLFVMPSYHEGLPIALLEAMSYNLDVLVSDIPANAEVRLEDECYFSVRNVKELTTKIKTQLSTKSNKDYRNLLKEKYNWDVIANQTMNVYEKLKD